MLLLLAADVFCDSPFKVSVGNVLIDKNTVPYKIDNSSHSYVCDFIGNDKIECYTVDYDEYGSVISEKEYALELERKSEDSAVLKIFGRDGSLQKKHQIAFLAESKVKINRDTYVLRGDSYKELKNNVLKKGQRAAGIPQGDAFLLSRFCLFQLSHFHATKIQHDKIFYTFRKPSFFIGAIELDL